MRIIFLILSTSLLAQTTFSQSNSASGTVKDKNGNPIAAALVSEFKSDPAAATYTDSLGFFSFAVKKYAKLLISCEGYNDTLVNMNDKKDIFIILTKAKNVKHSNNVADNTENPLINKNLLQDAISTQSGINNNYVYGGGTRNYTGSLLPVFTDKEDTKGSRYLCKDWAPGFVVNADNSIFNNPGYLYNYDKTGGGLLQTSDKQSAIEVDKAKIKSFTIYIDKDKPLVFENVLSLDNAHFVQVISSGNKYKIYKLTKTKFVKSNYHTDAFASSGNPYDEYIDENFYFVLNIQNNQMQKFGLKKKSVREAFISEKDKADKFFSENNSDIINDISLKSLGDYLNK